MVPRTQDESSNNQKCCMCTLLVLTHSYVNMPVSSSKNAFQIQFYLSNKTFPLGQTMLCHRTCLPFSSLCVAWKTTWSLFNIEYSSLLLSPSFFSSIWLFFRLLLYILNRIVLFSPFSAIIPKWKWITARFVVNARASFKVLRSTQQVWCKYWPLTDLLLVYLFNCRYCYHNLLQPDENWVVWYARVLFSSSSDGNRL